MEPTSNSSCFRRKFTQIPLILGFSLRVLGLWTGTSTYYHESSKTMSSVKRKPEDEQSQECAQNQDLEELSLIITKSPLKRNGNYTESYMYKERKQLVLGCLGFT